MTTKLLLALSAASLLFTPALAQPLAKSVPQALPVPSTVPDARDVPYPGTMKLHIDATDTARGLYRVTETVPVPEGARELILQFPEWLPGNHAARGPINLLADIRFEVDGHPVNWTRNPLEVHAFHIPLPEGRGRSPHASCTRPRCRATRAGSR